MGLKEIDFNNKVRLVIGGVDYFASPDFSIKDHVFNNAGSSMELKEVYPVALDNIDPQRYTPFKLNKYDLAEVYFGDELLNFGVVKMQTGGSLSPRKPKHIDIKVISYKEFLTKKTLDFSVKNVSPEYIVDKVLENLGNKRITKGTLSFGNTNNIVAYNFQSKNAWEALRFVEKHTNSMFQVLLDSTSKELKINFYNRQSIVNTNNGNKGIDLDLSDDAKIETFETIYGLEDIEWSENNGTNRNKIRVESEKILFSKEQIQTIELSQGDSNPRLQFNVGKVDKKKTQAVIDGVTRKTLIIITTAEKEAGKAYDIVYSDSDTIELHPRLVGKNGTLTFVYYPYGRQSLDFQDSADKAIIAQNSGDNSGELTQYEKHNDIGNLQDLAAMGIRYLNNGTDDKTKLTVVSNKAIWNLGEHTNFTYKGFDGFDGEYVVREYELKIIARKTNGADRIEFKYALIKTQDFENDTNFDDSMNYRDNPSFDVEDEIVDTTTAIDTNIFIVATNLVDECLDIKDEEKFDYDNDITVGIDTEGTKDGNIIWTY